MHVFSPAPGAGYRTNAAPTRRAAVGLQVEPRTVKVDFSTGNEELLSVLLFSGSALRTRSGLALLFS